MEEKIVPPGASLRSAKCGSPQALTSFGLGQIIYETRIREAWGRMADLRLSQSPWPEHEGAERAAEHDLAIACAKAVLKAVQP